MDSVQSLFCLQRRTICWPVQLDPSVVGQLPSEVHATLTPPLLQLGGDPPVSMIVAQHTGPEAPQSEGLAHAKPASFPVDPELDPVPELLPEPLPDPVPELLPAGEPLEPPEDPDALAVPELEPELPPEPDADA